MNTVLLHPGQVALVVGMDTNSDLSFQLLHEDDMSSAEGNMRMTKLLFLMSGLVEILKNEPEHVALSASQFYEALNETTQAVANEDDPVVGGVLADLEKREST